jgi:RNA polymerase sigma-70 factor, ECF subfamily
MARKPRTGTRPSTGGGGPSEKPATLGELLATVAPTPTVLEEEWAGIVRAVASGDQGALRDLYERSNRLAFALILRITRSRDIAEEVTVDVFHEVWRRAGRYDPANGTVLGWIMNLSRSRAIDRLRYERRGKRVNHHAHDPASLHSDPPADHDDAIDLDALRGRIRTAVGVLKPEEREAIEAAYFSGLSYAEVAERFDLPLGTVKSRIRSGLRKLRERLESADGHD